MIFGGQPQEDWPEGEERINRSCWRVLLCLESSKLQSHFMIFYDSYCNILWFHFPSQVVCFLRLIFIGRNLDRDELQRGFRATLA